MKKMMSEPTACFSNSIYYSLHNIVRVHFCVLLGPKIPVLVYICPDDLETLIFETPTLELV